MANDKEKLDGQAAFFSSPVAQDGKRRRSEIGIYVQHSDRRDSIMSEQEASIRTPSAPGLSMGRLGIFEDETDVGDPALQGRARPMMSHGAFDRGIAANGSGRAFSLKTNYPNSVWRIAMQEKLLLAVCSCALVCSLAAPQTIEVDFGKQDPTDPAFYGRYINICGGGQEFTESDLKLFEEQMGRLKLVRIWGTTFAKYAQQMADEALMVSSQVTLLKQLFEGVITEQGYTSSVAKSIEKAKDQYPFITYIEPFNELSPKSIKPPAGVSMEEAYYRGFRATYRAVNELNREHAYAKPLKVGGCACMWPQYKKGYIKNFLACYAKDSDPGKRLDFISVHFYTDDFEKIMSFRRDIEETLKELRLPVPQLIMSEVGWKEPGAQKYSSNPKDSLRWAMGSLAHTYQCAEQNVIPMHWVYPRKEDRHCMVAPAKEPPAFLPKGNAIKLAQMLKTGHAHSSVAIDSNGCGVYSVATYDETGVALLLWNYDAKEEPSKTVTLKFSHAEALPSQSGRAAEYRLEQNTGNYFADKTAWRLMPSDSGVKPILAFDGKKITLDGNAAYMLSIAY